MLANTIKADVERQSKAMVLEHPSVSVARSGGISREGVRRYLESLRYLFSSGPPQLRLAAEIARRRGLSDLVTFFEHKELEETGHDQWAVQDLQVYGTREGLEPFPAICELVAFLADVVERDPRLYAVYITTSEYFTVLAGGVWVEALHTGCGVPLESLTAVTKHIEADTLHAAAGFEALDELLTDESLLSAVTETVSHTMCLYWKFFDEVAAA